MRISDWSSDVCSSDLILKLVVLLPLVCGLMIGCLYLWRRLEARMPGQPANRLLAVKETLMISPGVKLAVLAFEGRKLLMSSSEEQTSGLQPLMNISYAGFRLKKKKSSLNTLYKQHL